ncbi:MAG TPA: MFS transporter [Chloroflexota bacterium]|nr:MFS transporter [Chloroflexota bacterium]
MIRNAYYGWIVALALMLLASVNNSGSFAFGMFLLPMSQQFGADRATLALAPTINRWLAGLLQPFGGYLADRFGPRALALVGATCFGVSMFLLAFARDPLGLYLAYGLLGGIGLAMAGGGTSARIIGAWFYRRRAVAMSLASGGVVVGQFVIVPILTVVMLRTQWQSASIVLAAIVLIVIVPVAALLVRDTPAEKGLRPEGADEQSQRYAVENPGVPLRDAVRTPVFWQLAFGLIACGVTMSFPNNHLMAFTMDLGMSPMTASEAIGLAGLLALPGSLSLGFLGDRVGHQRTLAAAYFLRAVTYIILLNPNEPSVILAAGLVLGLSWGATVPLTATVAADVFGTRSLATIVSVMTSLMYLASGTFTYAAGLDFDLTHSYEIALIVACTFGALAALVCALIHVPTTAGTQAVQPAAV